mgnify:CR=1 FL=1
MTKILFIIDKIESVGQAVPDLQTCNGKLKMKNNIK